MPSVRDTKRSAFSCEQCRKRKVKCDGQEPCARCKSRREECIYRQPPTLAYTQQLENRVKQLEAEVALLRSKTVDVIPLNPSVTVSVATTTEDDEDAVLAGDFNGLKLDDNGVTTYHGSTSFFHLLDDQKWTEDGLREADGRDTEFQQGSEMRNRLVYNAWYQREIETASHVPEPFHHLLNTHWCWVQPLFNFIYRPAFTRDMTVMGSYYSHTLMNAVLSHSVRWARNHTSTRELLHPYDDGAIFGRHARTMIFEELRQGICTIPTVQTLLVMSAEECSLGNCAQAWVYSGIAFRLIDHLGICFDGQRYGGSVKLSEEDIEIRRRLFWSCYFWDKVISLYLGRSPSIRESPVSPPQRMLDDYAEDELWQPHGVVFPPGQEYPAIKAHSTSSFVQICKLSVIFDQILIHLYDPLNQSSDNEIRKCVKEQGEALDHWWVQLPPFLKIEPQSLPQLSPPSHIVTLNCLYHTFRILTYRPMLSHRFLHAEATLEPDMSHLYQCVLSATSIVAIFGLFQKTFPNSPCVLSLNYSVYIAASIFLLQVQASANDQQALAFLGFCIRALKKACITNPIIAAGLNLLTKALGDLGIDASMLPEQETTDTLPVSDPSTSDQLPLEDLLGHATVHRQNFPFEDLGQLEISPQMFEAVSSLEPMPVTVGTLAGFNPEG